MREQPKSVSGRARAWPPALVLLSLSTLASACIEPRIEKPVAPDTSGVVADYASVSGEIESDTMMPTVLAVEETIESTGGLCGWQNIDGLLCSELEECNALFTCAGLENARALALQLKELILEAANSDDEEIESGGEQVLTTPFQQAEGYATLRHRCSGHGDTPTLEEANGGITMTAGFTNLTLDPVIWAEFDDCQFRLLNADFTRITLTGQLALVLSDGPVDADTEVQFLTVFDLDIETELGTLEIAASFLVEPDATRLVILIQRPEGDILFFSGPGRTGFITASGEYACDFVARRCIGSGGREVTW